MDAPLETVEIEPARPARGAVIWLHGLGADGHDFEPIVPELGLPAALPLRFVFPHAPLRPVTINAGHVMRAWYDIRDAAGMRREDVEGVRDSGRAITALIDREVARGVPAGHLVLAGFSQGGAMALHTGLRHPERLAGILALSCALPLAEALPGEASPASRDVPIFMAHGTDDALVPVARGRHARDRLVELGYAVTWREYRMAHAVCGAEVLEIGAWLGRVLGPAAA
jgi:phospholipase/carboxylesterase